MADLKAKDPRAHKMWLKEVAAQMDHQRFMEAAHFKMPLKVMQSAQRMALAAIVVFAILAGYALYLDHPWVATLFGVLDVATIVGLFLAPALGSGREDESNGQ